MSDKVWDIERRIVWRRRRRVAWRVAIVGYFAAGFMGVAWLVWGWL